MDNKMATIIEDPEFGNYYLGLTPFVQTMNVSLDIETSTYSLECDKTYNNDQCVGKFYGFPGSMTFDGKFKPGINHANGIICIENNSCYYNDYLKVVEGTVKKCLIEELSHNEELTHNEESVIGENTNEILPQCTLVECNINSNSELVYKTDTDSNSSNKICGKFYGTPGEYYYDSSLKRHNRRYGNEHSEGTISLFGRFNFEYYYNKGKISSCTFNNRKFI